MVSDENIDYCNVERSYDGANFETIGMVQNNNQSYSFIDINAEEKDIYYRILFFDYTGHKEYSSIVMVRSRNASSIHVSLVPNPVRSITSLKVETEQASAGTIRIVNTLGVVVHVQNINLSKGENNILLDNISSLNNGAYQVIVNAGNSSSNVKMMISR